MQRTRDKVKLHRQALGREPLIAVVLLAEDDRSMSPHLIYETLSLSHVEELATLLLNEKVYQHLGRSPPSLDRYRVSIERAIAGPPADRSNETWINYVVRDATVGQLAGRLEATIHAPVAEVAFLYGPAFWGRGYATRGLLWLHEHLLSRPTKLELWATTVPANERCQALLRRCGYSPVEITSAPHLISYDPGDLVFRGPCSAEQRNPADSR
jgi:RimJ/RimL family protein N-acetyltransferase